MWSPTTATSGTAYRLRRQGTNAFLNALTLCVVVVLLFPFVWMGRAVIRWTGRAETIEDENSLHPGWSNGLLSPGSMLSWLRQGSRRLENSLHDAVAHPKCPTPDTES